MIHHQHFFPIASDQGKLLPVFLAVLNMEPEHPEVIARNMERVLTARLRDAQFFFQSDRQQPLAEHQKRLDTVLFHKKIGTYLDKSEKVSELAAHLAAGLFKKPELAELAGAAGRLCKADLATDMVRELTELQGTMGGIYAREEGKPAKVWKAIYYHYLPIGVDADAPPSRKQLGDAAVTWAAVSLADKLDSVVGMFEAGERPTGSRDPLGLRRQAQGIVKILTDLSELTGLPVNPSLTIESMVKQAAKGGTLADDTQQALMAFMKERVIYLFEQRGFDVRNVRAVLHQWPSGINLAEIRQKLEALQQMSGSAELRGVATLFKRVKNISKDVPVFTAAVKSDALVEPAEQALVSALASRGTVIQDAAARRDYRAAFAEIALLQPVVTTFFDDVLVMADDARLREARLGLVGRLRDIILSMADISEIVEA
jgi:glycyl-tRNA synthetase beta chain